MKNTSRLFLLLIPFLTSSLYSEEAPCWEEDSLFDEFECIQLENDATKDLSLEEDLYLIACGKGSLRLSRSDQIPEERLKQETASYLEGYIQALIDANYYELNVIVYVNQEHTVFLYNLPKDSRIKHSILAFVRDLPEVLEVHEGNIDAVIDERIKNKQPIRRIKGVWFPESTVLFPPLIANPREPVYSIAYRWGDKVIAKNQIAVSLGDIFPIFRWFNVLRGGDMQLDVAACVWADFNMSPEPHPNGEWAELVTTDYLLSIPITYALDRWAFRLRVYHISSHLGDECMVNKPFIERVNPSFEALELMTSCQATDGLRIYLGPGFILNSDHSYPLKVFYFEYGLEWRFSGLRHHYHRLYGAPFFAADVQQWQVNHFRPSATLQLGYEWSKLQAAGRKVRIFAEYHNGYSEGQFFKENCQYIAIRGSWGF